MGRRRRIFVLNFMIGHVHHVYRSKTTRTEHRNINYNQINKTSRHHERTQKSAITHNIILCTAISPIEFVIFNIDCNAYAFVYNTISRCAVRGQRYSIVAILQDSPFRERTSIKEISILYALWHIFIFQTARCFLGFLRAKACNVVRAWRAKRSFRNDCNYFY